MADTPQLFGSAGQPLRRTGSQGFRSQGVRSQNRSGLDEMYLRNLGFSSKDAREGAIDLARSGSRLTRGGQVTTNSVFGQSPRGRLMPAATTQTPSTPRERFREKGTVASAAGVDLENLRDMATVKQPFVPSQPPQIMPATASDAAAGRMDVIGPGGSPTNIVSKYGTASVSSGPRKGEAMTRDTFAGRNIPLKEWLRQRRAAQMERGIA